jgi:hypothetical protein
MTENTQEDLGFTYIILKNGDLEIRHHGMYATKFRAKNAASTAVKLENKSFLEQQLLMARLTGNYKHGNERIAKNHPRKKH